MCNNIEIFTSKINKIDSVREISIQQMEFIVFANIQTFRENVSWTSEKNTK